MTIFKEIIDEEYLTVSETKEVLSALEADRVTEDRDMRYELARSIEHVNRFAVLEAEESRELVERLEDAHEEIDTPVAVKIADLLPRDRDELRSVFAQERYAVPGDELDELLAIIDEYR